MAIQKKWRLMTIKMCIVSMISVSHRKYQNAVDLTKALVINIVWLTLYGTLDDGDANSCRCRRIRICIK